MRINVTASRSAPASFSATLLAYATSSISADTERSSLLWTLRFRSVHLEVGSLLYFVLPTVIDAFIRFIEKYEEIR